MTSLYKNRHIENKTGFSLTFAHLSDALYSPGMFLTAAILFVGLSGCLWSILRLGEINVNPLPLAAVGLSYCFLTCGIPGKMWPVKLVGVAAIVLFTVAFSLQILDGFNILLNHIFILLEHLTGYIFPRYETAGADAPFPAGLFLVLPAVFVGMLSGRAVSGGKLWQAAVAILTVFAGVLVLVGFYNPDVWCVVLAAGLVALIVRSRMRGNTQPGQDVISLAILGQTAILLILCLIPVLFLNPSREDAARTLRRDTGRLIHHLRYGGEHGVLPEGEFADLQSFDPGDVPMLLLSTESPAEMYLRGYVGEIYTGMGWDKLETEHRGDYASLFSWLHDLDFFGQSQRSRLLEALGYGVSQQTVSISVVDAGRAVRFAPYEIVDASAHPGRIGDEKIVADGLHGQTQYTFQTTENLGIDYDDIAAELSSGRQAGFKQITDYLLLENAYREYVLDNYLSIPTQAETVISDFLVGIDLPADGRISFRDAQSIVRTYLSEGFIYTVTPEAISPEQDFTATFLTRTREGYSVHYATAAALMFRYLGFPARYVEGFYISERDAGSAEPGEPLVVDGTYAHAWAEVYRDGIGFVPFEVLPPDFEPEQRSDVDQGGSGGAEIPEEEPESDPLGSLWAVFMVLIYALVILLAVMILILVIRRYIKRRMLTQKLNAVDPAEAVSSITTWSVVLLENMGIKRQNKSLYAMESAIEQRFGLGEVYQRMVETQQRALFSRGTLSESEVVGPREFLKNTEAALRHNSKWHERLRLRWLKCLI